MFDWTKNIENQNKMICVYVLNWLIIISMFKNSWYWQKIEIYIYIYKFI